MCLVVREEAEDTLMLVRTALDGIVVSVMRLPSASTLAEYEAAAGKGDA